MADTDRPTDAGPPRSDDTVPGARSTPGYRTGTESYSSRSDDTVPGDASTPGYESDTEDYSSRVEVGSADAGATGEEAAGTSQQPFWKRLGFDSHDEYMRDLRRRQALYFPLGPGAEVPEPRIPGEEVAHVPVEPRELRRRGRQVNFKLRDSEAEDLDRAARIYGVRRATLARMLVNRGVKAILEDY